MKNQGAKGKTLSNFLSLSLLQIGNYVLPMVTLPIISRVIGPGYYGVINYAFAFVGYFVLLVNAGFDLYGSRLIVQHRDNPPERDRVFSNILTAKAYLSLLAGLVFTVCLFTVPQLREDKPVAVFTFLMCLGWVINPSWLYHGMQDSRRYAVFSFLSKLFFSVLVVLLVRERDDYLYHPLISSMAHLLVSLWSLHFACKKYGIRFSIPTLQEVRSTLAGNRKLALIWWVSNQAQSTNVVLAAFFLSTLEIGYLSAALRLIAIILSIIAMPLNTVLFPYMGEAFARSRQEGLDRVNKTMPYLVLVSGGVCLATFLFAGPVIMAFYGKEFAPAVPLLQLLSGVLFLSTLNGAFGQQVLLHLGKDNLYLRLVLLGAALNVALLPLTSSLWGIRGAALAWPLSEAALFLVYAFWFRSSRIGLCRPAYYRPSFLLAHLLQLVRLKTSR